MPSPEIIRKQIQDVTADLISSSLCEQQTFPSIRDLPGGYKSVSFQRDGNISIALKNIPYGDLYKELDKKRAFNMRMLDGALVQMMYLFNGDILESHRLAFLPSPTLEEFQNNPEVYQEDEIFADVIKKNIVPFPVRFDYDARDGVFTAIDHPKSHMTLGQYENCRIPVSAPVTPFMFCSFILRNFYHTAYLKFCDELTENKETFPSSIFDSEKSLIHVNTPAW